MLMPALIRSRITMIVIAIMICTSGLASTTQAADAVKPNIVFILADDLGYTDVGCYGSQYYETPNIDRMALEGVRFRNGYTCGPNCQPTRAALMSGQYGPRTGVYTVGGIDRFDWRSQKLRPVDNVENLPLKKVTLAQSLKAAGYATAMYGKWHLGQQGQFHPGQRGFDEAIVSMGKHFDFETIPKVEVPPGAYLADYLTDRAVDFIKRHQTTPFFLYLPHFGVHSPHQAKPELIDRFKKKAPVGDHRDPTYAAMIASVDESVGRLLKTLEELKLDENTLVIFSSDNGGVGGYAREGVKQGNGITDNQPLRGGKGMLHDGGIRVPYIFRWKGKIPAGLTRDQPIISVDLYPTLLEVAGAQPKRESYRLDGTSYCSLLLNKDDDANSSNRPPLFWHFPGYLGAGAGSFRTKPSGAIRDGDWKLIERFETNSIELYNLKDDIGEKHDLAKEQPEKAQELLQKLKAWQKSIKAPMPQPITEKDRTSPATAKKKAATKKKKQEKKELFKCSSKDSQFTNNGATTCA